ncbi:hypothetical protein C5E07_14350 [Pseudoclavibacter sp. RFBJ3]|uniref:DUF6157 family protein n=1 Tax=unclassified Pseudoclavibacter TaxID=2615177 RepID=UPI000CE7D465|nr:MULTISPECIES: DUF6157 family protein [unclassified Pseudoclavibacter]PPF81454.1 hypothetical protein C5C12_14090 [Pseudoclavibacter sp. RFBJ5]PPF90785.1 hypothetical protein C5E07_14350 [Pseudoclavibacter sp. RFBJ3]PPG00584.1 hypothetical protein C5C19_01380 [Pseudoclavibacter sp. RFBH5]PPG21081.1 hypothetical protein C5E13_14295 [Pseudoclavibacter sp. RFBI4]
MGTTNYASTFIQIADDCPVDEAEAPPESAKGPTIASLQHALIAAHPYEYTSDDVLFETYAVRNAVPAEERDAARVAFFAKDQACLRASPLGKRWGWGIHSDDEARVALVPLGSDEYEEKAGDASLTQLKAMRSKRA